MIKFKSLLVKIASLPLRDQRWLLKQLTSQQHKVFTQHQGASLLRQAQRFSKLPVAETKVTTATTIPQLAQELKTYSSLYIAIILEQGQFSWEKEFLITYPQNLSAHCLEQIKPESKLALFRHWQHTLSFSEQLEVEHGTNH